MLSRIEEKTKEDVRMSYMKSIEKSWRYRCINSRSLNVNIIIFPA